ncbi:MAG TPA: ATP-binding cassette domain-containing protein [Solirubrobacteraceae bacterium]|nr:ATP-binding cassette domain-containing protein [Solirubrobacteraceae bacterium]
MDLRSPGRRSRRTTQGRDVEIDRLLGEPFIRATLRRSAAPSLMTVLAVVLGVGLLGLAGWFIAASAVAGLAVTSTFSFLFPSAGVQALAWARTLARYGERITTHHATLDLVAALRTALFATAIRLPRDRAADLRSSELIGRLTIDSDAVEQTLLRSAFPIIAATAAALGAIAAFTSLSIRVGAVATAGLTITAATLVVAARKQAGAPAKTLVSARAAARRALIEALDGLPELRSFGAERLAAAEVARHLEIYADARRRMAKITARGHAVGTLLADLTLVVVIVAAAGLLGGGSLSTPWFVAVCVVTIAIFEPLGALPGAIVALVRGRAAAARIIELLPEPEASQSRARLPTAATLCLDLALPGQGVEGRLQPGDALVLTGASGAGKSTVLRAIAGSPASGFEIRLGDIDPATVPPKEIAARVTLVAQDAHVFDGTIRDNLLLAEPAADETELWDALAAAALRETVAGFSAGLDTPVGPGGAALSGGQRRRLSVAQGVLRRPAVLLLDEPTEGLDTATAGDLLASVRAAVPEAVLVIALHDRQAPELPWIPTQQIHLCPTFG